MDSYTNKPQVTLALCLCGGMHPVRGVLVFASQIIAGIASAGVVSCLFPGPLSVGTRLGGGTSISQGLFIEMFLTAHLVFVVIMLAVVKQKSTFLAPVGIGLVLFVNQLVGLYTRIVYIKTHTHTHVYADCETRNLLYRLCPQPCACPWP